MKLKAMIWAILGMGLGVFGQEIPATKVTLSLNDVSLSDAIKQISQQSGNPIALQFQESRGTTLKRIFGMAPTDRATLEAKEKPFWDVMLDLCEKNKLKFDRLTESDARLMITRGEPEKFPTFISGACMMRISEVEVLMSKDFRSKVDKSFILHMDMWMEPKSGVFKIGQNLIIDQASTADGVSLAPVIKMGDEPMFDDFFNPVLETFRIQLEYKPGIKSLKTFSGKIWVIQEAKSEDWVIETDKAVGATRTVCDLDTLKITDLRKEDNLINLGMEVVSTTGAENLMSYNQLAMRLRYGGYENKPGVYTNVDKLHVRSAGNQMIMTCSLITTFPKGIDQMPPKLMIRVPTEVKALQIPYEFHDVEMP